MKQQLKKLGLNPETFCFAPYIGTDLDQVGDVRTCYRGQQNIGNWKEERFIDVFNSDKAKEIRDALYTGKQHENCQSCWYAESHNAISPRMDFFKDYNLRLDEKEKDTLISRIKQDPLTAKIENFVRIEMRPSLLCNLRCMHCGPDSSTKWIEKLSVKENFDIYDHVVGIENGDTDVPFDNFNNHFKNGLTSKSKYKEDIKELLSSTKLIQFSGGEPLLAPEHTEWLDYLVNTSKTSYKQDLDYNSNFNINNIEKYFEYWDKFNKLIVRVSIDTSFLTYNYFRAEGNIELLTDNIKKFSHYFKGKSRRYIVGTVTFNMFSALRWKDIMFDWIENDLGFHSSLVLKNPTSSIHLPDDLKLKALADIEWTIAHVGDYSTDRYFVEDYLHHATNCYNFLKNSDYNNPKLTKNVCNFFNMCDRINNNNIFDYFPELSDYWYDGL
jgi:radical SAM protein with 4Fe4S-binding SPASM domain